MSSGQEELMAVRQEHVREGGIEVSNTTFVSSTDEGLVCHFTRAVITASY